MQYNRLYNKHWHVNKTIKAFFILFRTGHKALNETRQRAKPTAKSKLLQNTTIAVAKKYTCANNRTNLFAWEGWEEKLPIHWEERNGCWFSAMGSMGATSVVEINGCHRNGKRNGWQFSGMTNECYINGKWYECHINGKRSVCHEMGREMCAI